jgi:hypothetical protein
MREAFAGPPAFGETRIQSLKPYDGNICRSGWPLLLRTEGSDLRAPRSPRLSATLRGGGEQQAPSPRNPLQVFQLLLLQSMITASVIILEAAELLFVLGNLFLQIAVAVARPVGACVQRFR